ncbi:TetR/AcrR family transcriptional regulator [Pseudophaeobacter sp.]|uniref:TetR/AcrR family transcriptional regulator n=1 Tax=Pseudophaeobacter sp. TaxID=1971739 RepID=UPI003297FFFF
MSKADTKTKLMDAAEHQVCQKGADGFSYSDLSAEVGIRKASIHYHFPAKSDLLTAIMARYAQQVLATLEGYADQRPTPEEQLTAFVGFYRDALQQGSRLCLCVAFTVGRDGLSPDTRQEISRFRDAVQNWLQHRFEQMQSEGSFTSWIGDPKAEAAATLALVEGAQLAARSTADLSRYDAATQGLLERLHVA